MKRYPIVLLASDTSAHGYTGWRANGHVLCECDQMESVIRIGAAFIRINPTGTVHRVDTASKLFRVTPKYVNPCLACGSLTHKTYSPKCERHI
jgi:hypothetical protein